MSLATFEIKFQNPPSMAKKTGKTKNIWAERLQPLRKTKSWARVYGPLPSSRASAIAGHIKNGYYAGIDKGDFDAVSRTVDDGGSYVFVKHLRKG